MALYKPFPTSFFRSFKVVHNTNGRDYPCRVARIELSSPYAGQAASRAFQIPCRSQCDIRIQDYIRTYVYECQAFIINATVLEYR